MAFDFTYLEPGDSGPPVLSKRQFISLLSVQAKNFSKTV